MRNRDIVNDYFDWICDIVSKGMFADDISYKKLLVDLHSYSFRYQIPNDKNREGDGLALRMRYGLEKTHEFDMADHIAEEITMDIPDATVLEVMVALALRIEEGIMDDATIGNRTKHWFWRMIANLHLNGQTDDRYDRDYTKTRIDIFLDREYAPDGDGGLFRVKGVGDLRDVEIWTQALWFLDTIS